MIPITKPFLPPEKDFKRYVNAIWKREWLTNHGPLANMLELKLKEYLGVKHLLYVSNGTIALQLAIKALNLSGEIITTPFSFVATTNSIIWQGCKPVFVDIDPKTFNIDPAKIEEAITPRTTGILATHVYGEPCDIDAIQQVANKYNLKVIYDAAHCFGTKYKGRSVFEYGDISTTSFHSTKLYHTIEGGAVFTNSEALLDKMALLRSFGYSGTDTFSEPGINAKNCEFHAAMGLCNLEYVDELLAKRKLLYERYSQRLQYLDVQFQKLLSPHDFNYAYFPVLFKTEQLMKESMATLGEQEIFCRRYFYPSLSSLPYTEKAHMPVCESIAKRIICLPLYHALSITDVDMITNRLLDIQNRTEIRKADPLEILMPQPIGARASDLVINLNA